MARNALIIKTIKTKKKILKDKNKIFKLKKRMAESNDVSEVIIIMGLLEKNRGSSSTRYRNRCSITGRPRGYRGRFGLCRNKIREFASFCFLPGVKKSSW